MSTGEQMVTSDASAAGFSNCQRDDHDRANVGEVEQVIGESSRGLRKGVGRVILALFKNQK
jgi:hypothetical protein